MTGSAWERFSLPATYDVDDSCPGIVLATYLNDELNDCVIAARAHHTVRLAYVPGSAVLISSCEIQTEYFLEAGPYGDGINLPNSLDRWKHPGWTAGRVLRAIDGWTGAFQLTNSGMLSGDATLDISRSELKAFIIDHTGVQAELDLPNGIIGVQGTFGPNADWTNTSGDKLLKNRHVMLLTGYDDSGPIGITWGSRQHMSWAFIEKYCVGIYWVQKGSST